MLGRKDIIDLFKTIGKITDDIIELRKIVGDSLSKAIDDVIKEVVKLRSRIIQIENKPCMKIERAFSKREMSVLLKIIREKSLKDMRRI